MKRSLLLGTLLAALLGALVGFAPSASASALGYSVWGVHNFKDIPVPSGTMQGEIVGTGLDWTKADGSFISAANLCNWNFKVVFYEGARSANKTTSFTQPTQGGCTLSGAYVRTNREGTSAQAGSVCIELYRDFGDERLSAVCHAISP